MTNQERRNGFRNKTETGEEKHMGALTKVKLIKWTREMDLKRKKNNVNKVNLVPFSPPTPCLRSILTSLLFNLGSSLGGTALDH